jgi:hypothetical protein
MDIIKLLPKFYSNEEKRAKTKECEAARKDLITSGVLFKEMVNSLNSLELNMFRIADTYSRNYEIKKLNVYIEIANTLSKIKKEEGN